MHCQVSVRHAPLSEQEMRSLLGQVFLPHNPGVLNQSPTFGGGGAAWQAVVLYASETPDYRLICCQPHQAELQVWVEPIHGDVRRACQSSWDGLRHALHDHRPRLEGAVLVDTATSTTIMAARAGFTLHVRRRESLTLITLALLAAVFYAVGYFSYARHSRAPSFFASIPAVVGGVIALVFAVREWARGRLLWET